MFNTFGLRLCGDVRSMFARDSDKTFLAYFRFLNRRV